MLFSVHISNSILHLTPMICRTIYRAAFQSCFSQPASNP